MAFVSADATTTPPSRTFMVIHYVTYVGITAHAAFIALFAWLHVPLLAWFNLYSVIAWIGARLANRRGRFYLAVGLLMTEVLAHAVLAVWLLGWESGFHFYLVPVVPFLMFNDQLDTRRVFAGAGLVAVIYLTLRVITLELPNPPMDPMVLHAIQCMNILVPLSALAVICAYFRAASIGLERNLEVLAMTDALTKLPNRRHMRELLDYERTRSARAKTRFAVVLGDVDGFKQINDTRGHDCGDEVLRTLARVLRAQLRAQDMVARWGGEEFIFLLPDTELAGAATAAEKLRVAVETAQIQFGSEALRVAMTFGVATCDAQLAVDECVRRADRALYIGKDRGKNRVVLESEAA
jgi:diguanylate cyclase (GGDEF)-like protein